MKTLLTFLFLFSSLSFAGLSCDLSVSGLKQLKLTEVEVAKVHLYLDSKNYNMNPQYSYVNEIYQINLNSIQLSELRTKKLKEIEHPIYLGNEPVKILSTKTKNKDKGSIGYQVVMGLMRDLPKCNKRNEIALNDSDRNFPKEDFIGYPFESYTGLSLGMGTFGY